MWICCDYHKFHGDLAKVWKRVVAIQWDAKFEDKTKLARDAKTNPKIFHACIQSKKSRVNVQEPWKG